MTEPIEARLYRLEEKVAALEQLPEHNFVDVMREIRSVSGLSLKEAKTIGDHLRQLHYLVVKPL